MKIRFKNNNTFILENNFFTENFDSLRNETLLSFAIKDNTNLYFWKALLQDEDNLSLIDILDDNDEIIYSFTNYKYLSQISRICNDNNCTINIVLKDVKEDLYMQTITKISEKILELL